MAISAYWTVKGFARSHFYFVLFLQVGAGQQADGELDEPGPGLQAANLRRGHQGYRHPLDQRYWEGENISFAFLSTTYNFSSFNISYLLWKHLK